MQNASELSHKERKAIRLTFNYESATVRLVDRQIIDKPTQPSAPILKQGKKQQAQSGFWIELHSKGGQALYRLVMSNPIRFHTELPDGEGGFTNLPRPKPSGVFFVIVPNLAEAETIVVFSSPLGPEAKPGPAEPIARFPLRSRKEV